MAAAKREYISIFAIGGRLLGSFKGAIAMAQTRLKGLSATAKRVGSIMKTALLGMLAGFATFGLANIFKEIFSGAAREAQEAEQRTRALYNALLLNDKLRKAGPDAVQKQLDLIYKHNAALEQQGVLHKDILDNISIQLAMRSGLPSGAIQDSVDIMQNLLVAVKGVNASEEDGIAIGNAWANATAGGKLIGLRKFGVKITKEQVKEFGKIKGTINGVTAVQRRQLWLEKNIGKAYRDVNAAARNTPFGRIQLFHNAVKSLSNEIGDTLTPAWADMADAMRTFIEDPEIRGMLLKSVRATSKAISVVANIIKDDLIPVLSAVGESEAFKRIAGYAKSAARDVKQLLDLLGLTARVGKPYDTTQDEVRKAFAGVPGPYRPEVSPMMKALEPARKLTGLDLFKPHVTAAKDFNAVTSISTDRTAAQAKAMEDLKALGRDIVLVQTTLSPKVLDVAVQMTKQADAVAKVGEKTQDAYKWWQALHELWLEMARTGVFGNVAQVLAEQGARENAAAAAALPGHQAGGIFTQPHIARIAENGPEAVVPLGKKPYMGHVGWTTSWGKRLQGWMDAYSGFKQRERSYYGEVGGRFWNRTKEQMSTLGSVLGKVSKFPMSSGTHPTTVSFAPSITINGNATEAEQAALDARLRDLARDFVADFTAAQNHERRLSYEGGYS